METLNISDQLGLPVVRLQKPRSEPDYYGVSDLIATQLKMSLPPPVSIVSWLHGWRFQDVKLPGELILGFNKHMKRHLIAKEEHTQFLRERGYKNVETVGMPFTYLFSEEDLKDRSKVIPNSLLVMPPHSTGAIDAAPEEEAYINFVKNSVDKDTFLCFCVHQDCEARGYWVPTLKKMGIPYVTGSKIEDRNGLERMKIIFSHFESMTTNVFGSHILQASLCGLRVSVCGPLHKIDFNGVVKTNHWLYKKEDIDAYKNLLTGYDYAILSEMYPQFFVEIAEAQTNQEWAKKESGFDHKKDWETIAKLLGWDSPFLNLVDYHSLRYWRLFKREVEYYFYKSFSK